MKKTSRLSQGDPGYFGWRCQLCQVFVLWPTFRSVSFSDFRSVGIYPNCFNKQEQQHLDFVFSTFYIIKEASSSKSMFYNFIFNFLSESCDPLTFPLPHLQRLEAAIRWYIINAQVHCSCSWMDKTYSTTYQPGSSVLWSASTNVPNATLPSQIQLEKY